MIELYEIKRLQEQDIEAYFKDCGREYFDCGEDYYQSEVTIYIKLDSGKIFEIDMEANCEGNKSDYGGRFYFVDEITKVSYKEVNESVLIDMQLRDFLDEREQFYANLKQIDNKICKLVARKYELEEGK